MKASFQFLRRPLADWQLLMIYAVLVFYLTPKVLNVLSYFLITTQ